MTANAPVPYLRSAPSIARQIEAWAHDLHETAQTQAEQLYGYDDLLPGLEYAAREASTRRRIVEEEAEEIREWRARSPEDLARESLVGEPAAAIAERQAGGMLHSRRELAQQLQCVLQDAADQGISTADVREVLREVLHEVPAPDRHDDATMTAERVRAAYLQSANEMRRATSVSAGLDVQPAGQHSARDQNQDGQER